MNTATSFRGTLYDNMKEPPAGSAVPSTDEKKSTSEPNASSGVAVRLIPVAGSDAAAVANYVAISPSHGMVYIDFGFLEPSLLFAVQRLLQEGREVPEVVNGRLASRVAMTYDVVLQLYHQLTQLLISLQRPEQPDGATPAAKN